MQKYLRCLIALNWTIAGVAFVMAYFHGGWWYATKDGIQQEERYWDSKPSETDTLKTELRQQTSEKMDGLHLWGAIGSWSLVVVGCVNAVCLIIFFRRFAHASVSRQTG